MKTFLQWAEENDFEVPNLDVTSENIKRTGVGPFYPDAYYQGRYPDSYFTPSKATADLDRENAKKMKKDIPG